MRGRASGTHGALVIKGCTEDDINADGVGASRRPVLQGGRRETEAQNEMQLAQGHTGNPYSMAGTLGECAKAASCGLSSGIAFPKLYAEAPFSASGELQEPSGVASRIFHHRANCQGT